MLLSKEKRSGHPSHPSSIRHRCERRLEVARCFRGNRTRSIFLSVGKQGGEKRERVGVGNGGGDD